MNSVNKFTSISASAVAVLRRRQRGGGGVGATMALPRKMFEEAQMVRRVRAYLTSFVPLDDETKLAEMSNQCEPPTGGGTAFAMIIFMCLIIIIIFSCQFFKCPHNKNVLLGQLMHRMDRNYAITSNEQCLTFI